MIVNSSVQAIFDKIEEYKKKYYTNLLLKGIIIGLGLILSVFIIINSLEYLGRFNSNIRGGLLLLFVGVSIYTLVFLIAKPLLYLFHLNEPLSTDKAAKQIGKFFPEIGDKLLNTIQLSSINTESNELLTASISQKTNDLKFVKFADAVNFKDNRKYLKYIIPPVALLILISAVSPSFFTKNTERIIYFQKDFAEDAPFKFKLINKDLKAVKNEDFNLKLALIGNVIPEEVFLVYNGRKFKMTIENGKTYSFNFDKIQEDIEFHFLASGFKSNSYDIELISRPNLLNFNVDLNYPSYLNKSSESFENVGNLVVPEGTVINWEFNTEETDSMAIIFDEKTKVKIKKTLLGDFNYQKRAISTANYKIALQNGHSTNKDEITYYINVIPDKYPLIQLDQLKDTTMFNYIVLGGNIADDYGISDFKLFYRTKKEGQNPAAFQAINIPFNKTSNSQSFFYQLALDKLNLSKNDDIEYYLQVWDNDGVNGHKATKTTMMSFGIPSNKEFDQQIDKQIDRTEDKFEDILKKSKEFKKSIDDLDKNLKSKKEIDFQEKKQINELLEKKNQLMEEMKNLQKEMEKLLEQQNRFDKQSPELQKKMEQLQKLMEDIMKNEDSQMFEELKKLMDQDQDEKAIDKLEQLKNKERNLDKDIDRTLKLFKNLQLKQKVEQTAKELEKLAEKQEKLADKTEKESDPKKSDELKKEQEKLSKEFEEKKDKLKEIDKLSKEAKKDVDTKKEEQKEASEEQKKAEDKIDKGDNKGASESQKKAAKKMKKMAGEMMEGMASAESKELELDIDALRAILENTVKMSFEQEKIMKGFKGMNAADPRFIQLSQEQLKLVDDAKVIEDSLYSLSKKVLQIEALVTKEVTNMKNYMDASIKTIKDRKLNETTSNQQFTMTSVNNLALMLSDTFKQMQQMMASSMPGSGKSGKNGKTPMPGLGEKQEEINKKMKGMGGSGMGGKQMSEELAKLANEQAKLRQQIQKLKEDLNGTELGKKIGNKLEELQKQMDQSENDMVNKRINPTTIKRNSEILTRLLEAEKAVKEQEMDDKRKSKTATNFNRPSPPELEKFMKEKQKQLELIRTTPPNFTPFYKTQTDNYFKRIN